MKKSTKLPDMILLDVNPAMTMSWKKYFSAEGVKVVTSDLGEFMEKHGNEVDAIVSPANSFGIMDGGYDKAIIEIFGRELQSLVQEKIRRKYYGEQPVGTALSVEIPGSSKILIHVPTMRIPQRIKDETVIYHCMRSMLMEAVAQKIKTVLVPAFGGSTGQVPPETIARMMWGAYVQLSVAYPVSGWEEVIDYTEEWLWQDYFNKF